MVVLNELKPFNYLTDPNFENQVVQIIQVNVHDGNKGIVTDDGGYAYNVDLRILNPILLSPEILESIGFNKYGTTGMFIFNNILVDTKYASDAYKVLMLDSGQWFGVTYAQMLHDLQNIIHALLGEQIKYEKQAKH